MPSCPPGSKPTLARTVIAAAIAAAALCAPASATASEHCDRVASPSGSDSAAGTAAAPFRTVQTLSSSLAPGQTGCLRSGSYGGGDARLEQPDTTLTSFPGERANVTAMLEVMPGAKRARVHHLRFDATNADSTSAIKLQADDVVLSDNQITKGGRGICVQAATFTEARRIVIERNRIFNCGPSHSKFDHQIYLESSRDAVVRRNILTGNKGGWGVHLYSDADGTLVEHNIIDGNRGGVVFAGDGTETSDRNVVRNNAVTNSGPRWNVESSWSGGARGTGNSAHHNCLHTAGQSRGGLERGDGGFSASSNAVVAKSPYVNRARGDLRFKAGSKCARLVGDVAGPSVRARVASVRIALSLRSRHHRVRPGATAALKGRLVTPGRARGMRVRLQIRSHGGWRTLAVRKTTSAGRFSVRLRAGKARRARVSRLRAVVSGVAKSRVVRLRVSSR